SGDCAWVGSASSPEIISGAANQQRQPAVPFPRPPMCRFMAVILAFSSRLPGFSGRLRYATRSARRADRTPTSFSSSRLQAGKTPTRRDAPSCRAEPPMPAALDLLRTRRSVKPAELSEPGPSPAQIDTLLGIASRVPDHGKLAPWRFIVFAGEARLKAGEKIADAFAADHP